MTPANVLVCIRPLNVFFMDTPNLSVFLYAFTRPINVFFMDARPANVAWQMHETCECCRMSAPVRWLCLYGQDSRIMLCGSIRQWDWHWLVELDAKLNAQRSMLSLHVDPCVRALGVERTDSCDLLQGGAVSVLFKSCIWSYTHRPPCVRCRVEGSESCD